MGRHDRPGGAGSSSRGCPVSIVRTLAKNVVGAGRVHINSYTIWRDAIGRTIPPLAASRQFLIHPHTILLLSRARKCYHMLWPLSGEASGTGSPAVWGGSRRGGRDAVPKAALPCGRAWEGQQGVARLLARGLNETEASHLTGYALSRISSLKRDPLFAHYAEAYRLQQRESPKGPRSDVARGRGRLWPAHTRTALGQPRRRAGIGRPRCL